MDQNNEAQPMEAPSSFEQLTASQPQNKSMADLKKEREEMKRMKKEREHSRAVNEGVATVDETTSNLETLISERMQAVHQMLQKEKYYDLMQTTYRQQRANLPTGVRIANKITGLVGYKLGVVACLDDKIQRLDTMKEASYEKAHNPMIQEAIEGYLGSCELKVKRSSQLRKDQSAKREVYVGALNGHQSQARRTANTIVLLEKRLDEYHAGITNAEKEVLDMYRTPKEKMTREQKVALEVKERTLQMYRDNLNSAQNEITDSQIELETLDKEIQGLSGQARLSEAVEAKYVKAHSTVQANVARLRQYMRNGSDVGYIAMLEALGQLVDSNKGIASCLGAYDNFVKDSFLAIPEVDMQSLDTDLGEVIETANVEGKSERSNLVQRYATIQ